MADLQLVGGGNEFTAIPETCGRFDGKQVNDERDEKNGPAGQYIGSPESIHVRLIHKIRKP
jgi:hypothetical protein